MLRGLKTKETEKFNRFWMLVQEEAARQNCVYLAEGADNHWEEFADIECYDISGWLIPMDKIEAAEAAWGKSNHFDDMLEWEDYFAFAVWSMENGEIRIEFKTYDWE